jgi:putative restriction endonuclease
MAKAILTTKITPAYDDRPEEFYHFPGTYLNFLKRAIGDHIIYYEPRRSSSADSSRGGRQAYFACARLDRIEPDVQMPDHYYAHVSDYLDFDRPVPFVEGGEYYESSLKKLDGSTNRGAFGRAVRLISDHELDRILKSGFAAEISPNNRHTLPETHAFHEPEVEFIRPVVELTVMRPFRDRVFKQSVRAAYDNRCALTGLRLINGGGRPEVQAAHIKPVASSGTDSVRNGVALSGTIHWLFDRGLLSIDDNHTILIAKNKVPDQVRRLLNEDGKLREPTSENLRPHPYYLKFHRENVFKG